MKLRRCAFVLAVLVLLLAAPAGACRKEAPDPWLVYHETSSLLDPAAPGFGVDTGRQEQPLHYPMAYAVYASAEAHRAVACQDEEAWQNAVGAALWLVEHNDLDSDGEIGWGIPFAWDAGGDGSVNPAHTEYAITTALAIRALLDVWDGAAQFEGRSASLRSRLLDSALGGFDTFRDCYDVTPYGPVFLYSTAPDDGFHIANTHAMLVGQFQRLSAYPVAPETGVELERVAAAGFGYLRNRMNRDSAGVAYWNYADDRPAGGTPRPNDAVHSGYTLEGVLDYQLYSGTEAILLRDEDVAANIGRFLDGSLVWEFPAGPDELPARLFGVGQLLYLSARLDRDELAASLYSALAEQYRAGGRLVLRPAGDDLRVYPRQIAHALLGLSYYLC